jgi:phage shock protein A
MRFLDRLTLLIRADAHGVLEQLEERSLLAKQHLREAELELTRKRARAEALEEESRRLTDEAERLDREIASLDEDVELALAGDKDELARFSVRRLLPKRRAVAELRERVALIDEQRRQLLTRLEGQELELEELRRRVRARLAAEHADETGRLRETELPAADEEVELELLRRRAAPAGGGTQ